MNHWFARFAVQLQLPWPLPCSEPHSHFAKALRSYQSITGRIRDARTEITSRLESLQQHPDLHHTELYAIQDALNNLRVLEREEERPAGEDKKRILQETVQTLRAIAPKFGEPDQQ